MNLKKLILAISGLGIVSMLFVCVNFYIEKNKPVQTAGIQRSNNEIKTAFQPASEKEQTQKNTQNQEMNAPSLGANTMLSENIPPAMLKAMQEKGMSIEDLQKSAPAAQQTMPAMPKGKAFPKEMLEAMEKQKQEQQNQEQSAQMGVTPADPVEKAIAHIKGHGDEKLNKHLEHTLAALQENPADETALTSVTEIFLAHNEIKGAEMLLQKGIISAPNNAILPFLYGQVLAQNSQYEQTAEQWERALSLQDSAELHYSLGMLYRYQLDKEELAKEHFQKAGALPQHDERLAEHLKIELEK